LTDSPWSLAEPLDGYLREVVLSLRQATEQGIRKVHDQPAEAQQSIDACREMLEVIMAGDVRAWVATG
jgi:hypothetical protein